MRRISTLDRVTRGPGAVATLAAILLALLGADLAHGEVTCGRLRPGLATLGSTFTLSIFGGPFTAESTITFDGQGVPVTSFTATTINGTVTVPLAGEPRTVTLAVTTPGEGTCEVPFALNAPLPVLTSISPTSAPAGSPSLTLTVVGENFLTASTVRWEPQPDDDSRRIRAAGSDLPSAPLTHAIIDLATTFVSATELTATIPAAELAADATVNVRVVTPGPGGGTSGVKPFVIGAGGSDGNPLPVLAALTPPTVPAGQEAAVTLTGTGFVAASEVRVNGAAQTTQFVSSTQLQATIAASALAALGTVSLAVVNPAPGGGTSASLPLEVGAPVPVIAGIVPATAPAGSGPVTVHVAAAGGTVTGSSVIQIAGAPLLTASGGAGTLSAQIPADVLAQPGSIDVTVTTPGPGGGVSTAVPFTVVAPTLAAAVLPASRSVQVGTMATAFATIINMTGASAPDCGIAFPLDGPPGTYMFQTTDPATNALTGSPNARAAIPAGGVQSFLVGFTPAAPMAPTDVALRFACGTPEGSETDLALSTPGLNTLLLSASATPIPDIVALAASPDGNGIVTGPVGTTGVFSVASVNVGASSGITVVVDTGGAILPVGVSVCQTDPATGLCLSPPAPQLATVIDALATPTFGVFVQFNGVVPFLPAVNRVSVRFIDTGGVTRGATSVAIRTP